MKPRLRPFVALIAALLLVIAQQGALAHMIGHLGVAAHSSLQQDESGHDAALSLSHACTACIAFASLGGAMPGHRLPLQIDQADIAPAIPSVVFVFATRPLTVRARAPPTLL